MLSGTKYGEEPTSVNMRNRVIYWDFACDANQCKLHHDGALYVNMGEGSATQRRTDWITLETQQVEFQIDLVPSVAPVARGRYSKLQEFDLASCQTFDIWFLMTKFSPWGDSVLIYGISKRKMIFLDVYRLPSCGLLPSHRLFKGAARTLQCQAMKMLTQKSIEWRKKRGELWKLRGFVGMIKKLEPRADGTLCLRNRSWIPCYGDLRALELTATSRI
ncbi:hypothetical protein Tco_0308788 [Tanacetum coccineum]